jgi:hypothetical protein
MKVGTKSVLFGAHQFLIHPWFVAAAWWNLYGFPFDPRLWVAFFVHDLGYVGKPNMDGPEGETHVELGARIMGALFGAAWADFTRYHSRFYAKRDGRSFSRLCVADKLAVSLEPAWLYLPRVILTGEIREYMRLAGVRNPASKYAGEPPTKYESAGLDLSSRRAWFLNMTEFLRRWAYEHRDGRTDTWTPDVRESRDASGVWR